MSKRQVTDCDKCGAKDIAPARTPALGINVGRVSDGIEYEDDTRFFDLCHNCTRSLLQSLLSKMTHEEGRRLLTETLKLGEKNG